MFTFGVDRVGLTGTDFSNRRALEERSEQRFDGVHVCDGIERETAEVLCGIVAESTRATTVGCDFGSCEIRIAPAHRARYLGEAWVRIAR